MKLLIIGLMFQATQVVFSDSGDLMNKLKCTGYGACVSSVEELTKKYIAPYSLQNPGSAADKIKDILQGTERVKIQESNSNYIKAQFFSKFFRFEDNIELYIDYNSGLLHWKSQSKIGSYDFGVNRKRLEKLRKIFSNSNL